MAAPNIVNVSSVYGKTAVASLSTSTTDIVTNSAGSGTVLKINSLYVSNMNVSAQAANVMLNRSSTNYFLAPGASIPAYSTLTVIGKDTAIYLEEGDILQANASTTNAQVVCSYEIIG
jgi:hypothetical protein